MIFVSSQEQSSYFQFNWGEFKDNLICLHFLLHLKHEVVRSLAVEAGLDPVLVIVSGRVEIHVQEAVVDAVVLHVDQMVVGVKVLTLIIFEPLGVTELVIEAVLENQSVEAGRGEAKDHAHTKLQDEEEELFRHPVTINVSVEGEGAVEIVMQLVCMLIHLGQGELEGGRKCFLALSGYGTFLYAWNQFSS